MDAFAPAADSAARPKACEKTAFCETTDRMV